MNPIHRASPLPAVRPCSHATKLLLPILLSGFVTVAQAQTNYHQISALGPTVVSGAYLASPLTEGSDGLLYGTTFGGGSNSLGTVFKLNKGGSGLTVLHSFTGGDGSYPNGGLVQGTNGALYGTTTYSGSNDSGTVFKMDLSGGNFQTLHYFTNGNDGSSPYRGLTRGSDGVLYGTTQRGGSNSAGTVFKLHHDGTGYQVLHTFSDLGVGAYLPLTGVVEQVGVLYGTTYGGGSNDVGTVFKLNTTGSNYTVLRHFTGTGGDGRSPRTAVTIGSDGMLYGTTGSGGSNNFGILFRLNTNGSSYSVLHQLGGNDGNQPWGELVEGNDGRFYGTAIRGGSLDDVGTVFRLDKDGSNFMVLHAFADDNADGRHPQAGLIKASDGMLYGTTDGGGGISGFGTVFKLCDLTLSASVANGTSMLLSLSCGAPGQIYNLEATTNLTVTNSWQVIGSNTASSSGTFQFLDSNAVINLPSRFYRATVP